MKRKQDGSVHASALHIALAIALISISGVLLASTVRGRPDITLEMQYQNLQIREW
jgi:hypothetical protein